MKLQTFRKFLWLCLLWVSVAGYAQEAPETWMPDPALRLAVRETLELPAGVPLTKDHMRDLEIFIAEGRGISDLTGLEFAINLREANLGDNSITDLRPLANLIHLEELGLPENRISDISPLAGLPNLLQLIISLNPITDLSPLAGLPKFRKLIARGIWTTDFSSLEGLGFDIFADEICEIAPFPPPVPERIQNRTFPSLTFDFHSLIYNTKPVRWLNEWDDPDNYHDVATKHDMHYYTHRLGLRWALTPTAPTQALSTQLAGNIEEVLERYKKYDKNPNMLFIPAIVLHGYSLDDDDILSDSDLWLRDANGQLIKREELPADYKPQGVLAILNPKVQQLVIDRAVAVADCGFFDGVLFDSWDGYHQYYYGKYFNIDGEVVIQAYINILKGIRERVRDDFLILVNRNWRKSPRYAEWINGSFMETGPDRRDGYSYERLRGIEETLSWNEKYLREPRINVLFGKGIEEPIDSPDNLRWMRVITTLSLTHSDGYSVFVTLDPGGIMWHDFYDAHLGRPVGEKAQPYNNRSGIFIREFTKGWAVYNRSGRPQTISLPIEVTGAHSGLRDTEHVLADLDGEIYLKTAEVSNPADVNEDGVINVLDMVLVARHFGESVPPNSEIDINADGIVNILDLILVAQHMGKSTSSASPSILAMDSIGGLDPALIQAWIARAQVEDDGSVAFREGIAYLQSLLSLLIPEETALLPNYPNPFNPETWIPYQVSEPAEVTLRIYSVNGVLVRTLALGQMPAGIYQSRSRATHWDGRNDVGEFVASGVYFYTLTAGDFTATRKMLIRK